MSPRLLLRRRPSAALMVSFLALFVGLGGVGWAALRLPPRSVGNAQLQNFSVGNAKLRPNSVGANKIIAGAVGARQVNSSQVQLRVTSSCLIGAIQSLSVSGNVTCTPALPNEYGTSTTGTPVGPGAASTPVASEQLAGGSAGASYLVIANVQWAVSGSATGAQSVDLTCTLQAGASMQSGEFIAQLDANRTRQAATMPIVLPATITGSHGPAVTTCGFAAVPDTPTPTVTVDATINAIQTAANTDS